MFPNTSGYFARSTRRTRLRSIAGDRREPRCLQHVELLPRPRHHVLHDVRLDLTQVGVEAERILRRIGELVDDEHDRRESVVLRRVLVEHSPMKLASGSPGWPIIMITSGSRGASSTSAAGGR